MLGGQVPGPQQRRAFQVLVSHYLSDYFSYYS
jgi:hypothetical protein